MKTVEFWREKHHEGSIKPGELPLNVQESQFTARSLRAQVPELRTRAQTMLCRVRLPRIPVRHAEGDTHRARGPLTVGAFPELELRAEKIGWKGKADLLVLSADVCEITDFKTGAPDEGHRFQIHVYALLWSRDAELNPDRRRADHLILAYGGGETVVAAPTESELDELESLLLARREAARQAVSHDPPEARPDPQHCRYCGVRQLCDAYWTPETQRRMAEESEYRGFGDLEMTITGRHGPSSWDACVELSRNVPAGKLAVIRTNGDVEFRPNDRLRILDAALTVDDEDPEQPAVITLGTLSEVYLIPKS